MDFDEFEFDEMLYDITLDIDSVKLLHHCVTERIRLWEGSPARPAEEQEALWKMRDQLQAMIFEYNFHNL